MAVTPEQLDLCSVGVNASYKESGMFGTISKEKKSL
jgi:hypothetical protein